MCIRHFKESDYIKQKGDKFKLNPNVVPTIFENNNKRQSTQSSIDSVNDVDDHIEHIENNSTRGRIESNVSIIEELSDPINNSSGGELTNIIQESEVGNLVSAKSEVKILKNEIFKLKLDHDVKIQELKVKCQKNQLEEKAAKIHLLQNEIKRKTCKIQQLEELNGKLRASHIRADTTNITND